MTTTTTNLITITDGMLKSMMRDPRFIKEFPCLVSVRQSLDKLAKPGCGACRKARARKAAAAVRQGKNCLATLSAEKRAILKKLLNARQVRVIRVNPKGGSVRVTY